MLTYDMQNRDGASLYEHLYACIRADVEAGLIAANEKLPSKRSLAKHLGVSVITVEGAYTQLVAEGYVRAVPRCGYFANEVPALLDGSRMFHVKHSGTYAAVRGEEGEASDGGASADGRAGVSADAHATAGAGMDVCAAGRADAGVCGSSAGAPSASPLIADFTGATAPRGLFPYKMWARTTREALSAENEDTLLASLAPAGSFELRRTLADYLRGQRGMQVTPDQIVVGAGSQTLYNLLVQLLGRTRCYAVEEPGYPRLTRIYRSNDVALVHVPLDEAGVSVDALRESGADVLHCMPSHQLPTGLVTSIGRRRELLRWAAEGSFEGRYVIEDDYDCEFRMAGRPIPALQSIDDNETVIYANTFTNSLGPTFRIGYMVLPPHLARRFADKLGFYSCTVGAIDQLALERFIESGEYERHVNRLRSRFRHVQEALADALMASAVAPRLRLRNVGAGLHFLMDVDTDVPAEAIAARARAYGVALAPLGRYCSGEGERAGECTFVMSFASVPEESVGAAVDALVRSKCFT